MTRVHTLGFAACLVAACDSPPIRNQDQPSATRAVYAAVVHQAIAFHRAGVILLQDSTVRSPAERGFARRDIVPASIRTRLVRASAERHVADHRLFAKGVKVVSSSEGKRLTKEGAGTVMLLAVSPVVFSDDLSQALVYYELDCGSLCGQGTELWIRRETDGKWSIRQEIVHWVS